MQRASYSREALAALALLGTVGCSSGSDSATRSSASMWHDRELDDDIRNRPRQRGRDGCGGRLGWHRHQRRDQLEPNVVGAFQSDGPAYPSSYANSEDGCSYTTLELTESMVFARFECSVFRNGAHTDECMIGPSYLHFEGCASRL